MEVWRDIPGYEGLYQVSNSGHVKSMKRKYFNSGIGRDYCKAEKILTPRENKKRFGYFELSLHKDGKEKRFKLHRLVALAFVPNPNNYPQVNHIDGNKGNNSVENLEWCSCKYNINHALKTGLANKEYRMTRLQCVDTGEIFRSVVYASNALNCDRSSIFKSMRKNKPLKGHTFRRLSNEEYASLMGERELSGIP